MGSRDSPASGKHSQTMHICHLPEWVIDRIHCFCSRVMTQAALLPLLPVVVAQMNFSFAIQSHNKEILNERGQKTQRNTRAFWFTEGTFLVLFRVRSSIVDPYNDTSSTQFICHGNVTCERGCKAAEIDVLPSNLSGQQNLVCSLQGGQVKG